MSTLKVTNIQSNAAGFNDVVSFQNSGGTQNGTLCRAFINFNGTGIIETRASFNVSEIIDNGVGNYTITFTNAMVDANYIPVLSRGNITSGGGVNGFIILSDNFALPTTGGLSIATVNVAGTALQDPDRVCVAIFR